MDQQIYVYNFKGKKKKKRVHKLMNVMMMSSLVDKNILESTIFLLKKKKY